MQLPEYITKEEVKRICKECKLRDWTALSEALVTDEEARVILAEVNTQKMPIALTDFKEGLDVELEHGTQFSDANVTNNHPIITGKIVLAHMKESLDYYKLLRVAELEGDLAKAIQKDDSAKIKRVYKKLIEAQIALDTAISKQLT